MSNKNSISLTDVNSIYFTLTIFKRLSEVLPSYGLTFEDVLTDVNKFRRFIHIYRHHRLCYNSNPLTDDYKDINDLHMLFKMFFKQSPYYGKEKEES